MKGSSMATKTSTQKYFAVVGLDFEGIKPPARVEAGDPIPDRVPQKEITDLLAQGQIRERTEADK